MYLLCSWEHLVNSDHYTSPNMHLSKFDQFRHWIFSLRNQRKRRSYLRSINLCIGAKACVNMLGKRILTLKAFGLNKYTWRYFRLIYRQRQAWCFNDNINSLSFSFCGQQIYKEAETASLLILQVTMAVLRHGRNMWNDTRPGKGRQLSPKSHLSQNDHLLRRINVFLSWCAHKPSSVTYSCGLTSGITWLGKLPSPLPSISLCHMGEKENSSVSPEYW